MDIKISIATRQPPSGVVIPDEGAQCPFEGWLDLLGVLSDLITGGRASPTEVDPVLEGPVERKRRERHERHRGA